MSTIVAHGRFLALPLVMIIALATFIPGGVWLWLGGGLLLVLVVVLDEEGGDYRAGVAGPNHAFLNGLLFLGLPLSAALVACLVLLTSGDGTPARHLASAIGIMDPGAGGTAGAIVTVGLLLGAAAGGFGHELMHRSRRTEWWLGQGLLALCLYAPLAIEHVYGHHRTVGTPDDVATVPRGRSFWGYLPRALAGVHRGAARIEALRMRRRGVPVASSGNRFLQGLALEAAILAGVGLLGGVPALLAFAASAAVAVFVIEATNYVGHYGLVRVPGEPVLPRHSWNAPRFISSSMMVNLPRHSHHHLAAGTPFWQLQVPEDAPLYPCGTSIMSAIALVPPLWFRVLEPRLRDWDSRLASPGEIRLLAPGAPAGNASR